jgi:hypothetical protein
MTRSSHRRRYGAGAEQPEIWEPELPAEAWDMDWPMFWDELDWLWDSGAEGDEPVFPRAFH